MRLVRSASQTRLVRANGQDHTTARSSAVSGTVANRVSWAGSTDSNLAPDVDGTAQLRRARTGRAKAAARPRAAHEWVSAHPEVFVSHRGKWVAVGPRGILGIADDFDDAKADADAQGVSAPLIFKVPHARRGYRVVSNKLR